MAFTFDSGRICVDFIATQFGRPNARVKRLNAHYDLRDWIELSDLVHGARRMNHEQLRRPGAVLELRGNRVIRRGGFEEFLAEPATDALDLLSRPTELSRVRRCAANDCRLIFLDRSPTGRRRWCSKDCIDRRSSATYRARKLARPETQPAAG